MWNKFKELIEWNEYNTLSAYFIYFLDAYSSTNLKNRQYINVCKFTRVLLASIVGFLFIWSVAAFSAWCVLNVFIAIALIYNLGFDVANHAGFPIGCLLGFILITIVCGGVYLVETCKTYFRNRSYEAKKFRAKNPDVVIAKTVFEEWYDAFNSKFCVKIDLNKFRADTKKVVENSEDYL